VARSDERQSVTRRDFIRGSLGAVGLVAASGLPLASCRRSVDYDVCIVGSGFAGTTTALGTTSAGLRTVIVEAGSFPNRPPDEHALAPSFTYSNSGEFEYLPAAHRQIMVGGTSNHWRGVVNRLRPDDFRMQSEFGIGADWPIGYDELAPYYCKAEQALWVQGYPPIEGAEPSRDCAYPQPIDTPFRAPEIRIGGKPLRFFSPARSSRNGWPVRVADDEIRRFTSSGFGTLLTDRQVTRIVSLDGRSIDHVAIRSPDGDTQTLRARAFVVAAGVIETPRLLLLSRGQRGTVVPGIESRFVGRHFSAHPGFPWKLPPDSIPGLEPGVFRSYDLADAFRRDKLNAVHLQLLVVGHKPMWQLQTEMESRPDNRVRLSQTATDRFGNPLPDVSLSFSERDWQTRERGVEVLRGYARDAGLEAPRVKKTPNWRSHPSGTCRMANDARDGVVDQNSRVFGTDNLFVAGASVFPSSGTSNPTLTVVALAIRLGEHLVGVLKRA